MSRYLKRGVVIHRQDNPQPRVNNGGTWYDFTVQFDNGDRGEGSGKDGPDQYFVPGSQVEYTIDLAKPKYPKVYVPSKRDREAAQQQPPYQQQAPPPQQAPYQQQAPPPQQAPYQQQAPPPQQPPAALHDKDTLIIRQSSMSTAVRFMEASGVGMSFEELAALAKGIEAWVHRAEKVTPQDYENLPPF